VTSFDQCLREGIDDLLTVDGETAIWYPPNGAPGKSVTVARIMQTTPVEIAGSTALYEHRANVSNYEIDPETAQGGVLTVGKTDWHVVQVETVSTAASTFLLSRYPLHGRQGALVPTPPEPQETVTYQGGEVTYQAETVTYG